MVPVGARYSTLPGRPGCTSGDIGTASEAEIGLNGLDAPSTPDHTVLPQLNDQRSQDSGTEDTATGWHEMEEEEASEDEHSLSDVDGDVGAC